MTDPTGTPDPTPTTTPPSPLNVPPHPPTPTGAPAGHGDTVDIASLPEPVQKIIRDARAEASKARTTAKANAADEARKELAAQVAKALGIQVGDEPPDPAQLAAQVEAAKKQAVGTAPIGVPSRRANRRRPRPTVGLQVVPVAPGQRGNRRARHGRVHHPDHRRGEVLDGRTPAVQNRRPGARGTFQRTDHRRARGRRTHHRRATAADDPGTDHRGPRRRTTHAPPVTRGHHVHHPVPAGGLVRPTARGTA